MSLITTASIWINDEPNKKRVPSLRKTVKKMHNYELENNDYTDINQNEIHNTTDTKVHDLLDKMTSINTDNDGDSLANFQPLVYPSIDVTPPHVPQFQSKTETSNFTPDNVIKSVNSTGDLNHIYEGKPYYSNNTGIGKENNTNHKIFDRLGHIVHLLEQQHNEQTNNNFEESILYVLLGTFVIFIVDSFSRGGKYIR